MNQLLEGLLLKVKRATIEEDPFPYLMIDNFFPEEMMESLLKTFPDDTFFYDAKISSQNRKIIEREIDTNKFRDIFLNPCWNQLNEVINAPKFKKTLLNVFYKQLVKNGAELDPNDEITTQFDVTRATKGYARGTHLDRRNHLVNCFFYFNSNEEYQGEGGDLLLQRAKNILEVPDKFPDPSEVETVKVIPTAKNRFISFCATSSSYHAVTRITKAKGYRKFIYIAINNSSKEDVWPPTQVVSEKRRLEFINQ